MARTINEIQNEMIAALQERTGITLSTSKAAEWRLWTYVIAAGIHSFEIVLDVFKKEVDALTNQITPGTARWYAEMCYRYQDGHELLFDNKTAMLYYENPDQEAQIIKVVAIREEIKKLTIKAATNDQEGKIVPLSQEQLYNFTTYIDAIKFAGVDIDVVSTSEDKIRYNMIVYFEPAVPATMVRTNILAALDTYKASLGFDSRIYLQRFIDAVTRTAGVVTCNLVSLQRKGATDETFLPVGVYSELESGYFEYDKDSTITLKSIKELDV